MKIHYSRDKNIQKIDITVYLRPILYENSEIFSAVYYDTKKRKYTTDVNPNRIINGPLSGVGEELEPPIREEWDSFVEDGRFLATELGFTILSTHRSEDSNKSEYTIMIGLNDQLCGSLVFDLRISDHFLKDFRFPEDVKQEVVELLKVQNVLDGSATSAGIDFQVEQVVVGSVKNDSWNRALNRLYNLLRKLKFSVRTRLNRDSE